MKKRAIFDAMSYKHQQKILKKIGYENWDPFQEPKYPIDLREQEVEYKAMALSREFFQCCGIEKYSDGCIQAVKEISKGLIKNEERYRAIFDFCNWFRNKKEKEGS